MTSDEPRSSAPRHEDPPRPDLVVGLPVHPEIKRPKILLLATPLVLLSALAFIPSTADAITRRQGIRDMLEKELADRSPDYSSADIRTTVLVTLVGVAVLSVLFILAEIGSVRRVGRKVRSGRAWLLVLTVLHLPVIAISPFLRDGGRYDLASAAVQGACLALATFITFTPAVSRWLRDVQRQGPIPLRPSAERQS